MLFKLIGLSVSTSDALIHRILMSRLVRQLLFAALIACHAAVTVFGPCLHELPGSSHQFGPASKADRPDDPTPSRRDAADNCVVCHFVAQGQLPVESSSEHSVTVLHELTLYTHPPS